MSRPVSMQKLALAIFIASSALVIIAGAVWGFRYIALRSQATTQAAADNAIGGFPMSGDLAPDFKLTDQFGKSFTLSSLRGHEVVLAFIDSRCTTLCPLTAEIMYDARVNLGATAASQIELVAVNANPTATSVTTVQDWSIKHGMLHQWLFLTGTAQQLDAIYRQYKVYDQVNPDGTIEHDPLTLIIDAQGRERLYFETLDSTAQADVNSQESGLEYGMKQWLPKPQE